jgi:hypothetical protein
MPKASKIRNADSLYSHGWESTRAWRGLPLPSPRLTRSVGSINGGGSVSHRILPRRGRLAVPEVATSGDTALAGHTEPVEWKLRMALIKKPNGDHVRWDAVSSISRDGTRW